MLMPERYNEACPTPTSCHSLKQSRRLDFKRVLTWGESPFRWLGGFEFYFWFTIVTSNFIFGLQLYFSAPELLFLKNFLFWSFVVFLILLNCLSVFSWSSLSFLKIVTLDSFSDTSYIFISLWLVTGALCCPFGIVTFPWLFFLLVTMHWCLHIWKNRYLFRC